MSWLDAIALGWQGEHQAKAPNLRKQVQTYLSTRYGRSYEISCAKAGIARRRLFYPGRASLGGRSFFVAPNPKP